MMQSKTCVVCGEDYGRPSNREFARWATQRACSHTCNGVLRRRPKKQRGPVQKRKPLTTRIEENTVACETTGCWLWTGTTRQGYGTIKMSRNGKRLNVAAHRASYMAFVGPIPAGLVIDHLCANTLCMDPHHLEAVTPEENGRRGTHGKQKHEPRTHCPNGHEYPDGPGELRSNRRCKVCKAAGKRRYKAGARARAEAMLERAKTQ